MTDLSVIIVNWNAGEILLKCLESLKRGSTQHSMEAILVDNASTDGSPEAVRREFPNITLIQKQANLGFAKANNIGIRQSSGRYVLLINPDVIVTQESLDRMLEYMEEHPAIGMLGPKVLNTDSTLQFTCRNFPSLWACFCRALAVDVLVPWGWLTGDPLMRSWAHDTERHVEVLSGCFWMIRRSAIETVGVLDEDFFIYGEDIDYCQRFWQKGWEVVYWPGVQAVHYGAVSSSQMPTRFAIENLKANLQYWRKHRGRAAELGYTVISLLHRIRRVFQAPIHCLARPGKRRLILTDMKADLACIRWLLHSSI